MSGPDSLDRLRDVPQKVTARREEQRVDGDLLCALFAAALDRLLEGGLGQLEMRDPDAQLWRALLHPLGDALQVAMRFRTPTPVIDDHERAPLGLRDRLSPIVCAHNQIVAYAERAGQALFGRHAIARLGVALDRRLPARATAQDPHAAAPADQVVAAGTGDRKSGAAHGVDQQGAALNVDLYAVWAKLDLGHVGRLPFNAVSTAGVLIIGNEILSGKIQDENAPFLLRELRAQGVDVERVYTIPDEIDVIAEDVSCFSKAYTYAITTGGVGPTHDDVTMDGVARAFGRELVENGQMAAMMREALRGGKPNASQLKMCLLPSGAKLINTPDLWFPLVQVENVYIFPGIPRLLRAKFEAMRGVFVGAPFFLRRIFMGCIESDIAQQLHDLLEDFPELRLGSYPRIGEEEYRTLLTLESRDRSYVDRALDSLVARIPAADVVRVE